jgi:cysteine-rich repeat protein
MKVGFSAWLSLVLLSGCSSDGGQRVDTWCGNERVEEGEVCDGPYDGVAKGGCAYDCLSFCGNGTVEGPEVCDDGDVEDGDGCASNCLSACGNGQVEEDETCDDGNDTPGDGCYQCTRTGDVRWRSFESCAGTLSRGNDETLLVSCRDDSKHLFLRYGLDGARTEGPPPPLDPNEASNLPVLLAEQPSGDIYVVSQPTRNLTTANKPRVRVYRLQGDGAVEWSRDLTAFPDGPQEWASALAVGEGVVAVAGGFYPPNSLEFVSSPYLALLRETGELMWKKALPELRYGAASAVEVAEDGTVFVAGAWDLDLDTRLTSQVWLAAFDAEGTELWANTTKLGLTGSIADLRLSGGELEVLLRSVVQDDLVPDPPRITSTVQITALDAATGKSTSTRVLATQETNGSSWQAVEGTLPLGGFSSTESLDSYSYAPDVVAGYDSAGNEVFRSFDDGPKFSPAWVQGSLALGDLLCLNVRERESRILYCYDAR